MTNEHPTYEFKAWFVRKLRWETVCANLNTKFFELQQFCHLK